MAALTTKEVRARTLITFCITLKTYDLFILLLPTELEIHLIISITHLSYCVFVFIETIDSTMVITSFQVTDKK